MGVPHARREEDRGDRRRMACRSSSSEHFDTRTMARTSRTIGKKPTRRQAERRSATATQPVAAAAPVSLDDAAMRLVQAEPGDAESIARACEALEQLATDGALAGAVREALATAARAMRDAADDSEAAERAVAAAGRALEVAMREARDEQ